MLVLQQATPSTAFQEQLPPLQEGCLPMFDRQEGSGFKGKTILFQSMS